MLSSWSNGTFHMPWNPLNPKNEPITGQLILLSRRQLPPFKKDKTGGPISLPQRLNIRSVLSRLSRVSKSMLPFFDLKYSGSCYSLFDYISSDLQSEQSNQTKARYVPPCLNQPLLKAPPREAVLPLNPPPHSPAMFMWTSYTRTTKLPSLMSPSLHALGHTGTPTGKANS